MRYLTQTFVFLSLICTGISLPTEFEYDCRGLPEGFLYWWACGSYGICRGGQYAQIDCINGTTYDRRTGDCIPNSQQVTYPCNSAPEECGVYNGPGHRYPDRNADPVEALPPCTFYYTCAYSKYLGHQRCPEGQVYDEPQQRCLPPPQVTPPCGSFVDNGRGPHSFPGDAGDVRQVVQVQTDEHGNTDTNKWPFTQNRGGNRHPRGGTSSNGNGGTRAQRLFYRSTDRVAAPQTNFNPQDFNPAVYGVSAKEISANTEINAGDEKK